jgi:hypothetical protein
MRLLGSPSRVVITRTTAPFRHAATPPPSVPIQSVPSGSRNRARA